MKFKPDTLASAHEQMALVKAQSTGRFLTNYFRQEMVRPQILTAATARSVLLGNDEHDFFRLYFFTNDLADLERMLRDADFPGGVVGGYKSGRRRGRRKHCRRVSANPDSIPSPLTPHGSASTAPPTEAMAHTLP